jgi:hypothetical protein
MFQKIKDYVKEQMDYHAFLVEQRGQATVKKIIVVAATLFIGIKVISEIMDSISGLTGTANTTYGDIGDYMWTGFLFIGLGLLVLGAMYILGMIGGLGARG